MASELSSQQDTVMEEKEIQIISPSNVPILRTSYFLKPILPSSKNTIDCPHDPFSALSLSSVTLSILAQRVRFNCWRKSPQKWVMWVEILKPRFESKWKEAGIYEAIMASTYEIPIHRELVFKIVQKWCPVTNSFFFSFGEATVTLEDVMVLAGYSVVGDSVFSENHGNEFQEIENHLVKVRSEIIKGKARKACTGSWLNFWLDNEGKYEHEAFLAMWLSRFVFPCDALDLVNKSLFPMAIRLAHGIRVALAPVVLAALYRDLRLLKHRVMEYSKIDLRDIDGVNVGHLNVRAPLQLVQVWVCERFAALRPHSISANHGKPVLGRWHKSKIIGMGADDVGYCLENAEESFLWRPYDSSCCELYKEKEEVILVNDMMDMDLNLLSYARIIKVSELVGFDCTEKYLPNRVSRQFGFDQDIPDQVPRLNLSRNVAWSDYVKPISGLKLYIPSRHYNPGVTPRYSRWWKGLMQQVEESTRPEEVEDAQDIGEAGSYPGEGEDSKRTTVNTPKGWEDVLRVKKEMNEADVPPGFTPKMNVIVLEESSDDDVDHMTIGAMSALGNKSSKSFVSSSGDNVVSIELEQQTATRSGGSPFKDSVMKSGFQQNVEGGNQSNVGSPHRCNDVTDEKGTESSTENNAGDDVSIRVKQPSLRSLEKIVQYSSGTRNKVKQVVEDGIPSNVGSPASVKDINNENRSASNNNGARILGTDLQARIARLERITAMLRSGKIKLIKRN